MVKNEPTVLVVDDDEAMRDALRVLIRSVGMHVETYASADEFMAAYDPEHPGCLVLDVRMPGLSGLDLQERLLSDGQAPPIVFITGHGDIPMAVRAIKGGAVDFLEKPFRDQDLLDRIADAIDHDAQARANRTRHADVHARLQSLTRREKEVLTSVVEGLQNKEIAARLNLSPKTIEFHRAKLMEKMHADSVAELVRMAMLAEDGPVAAAG